jgi:hypothetical protein
MPFRVQPFSVYYTHSNKPTSPESTSQSQIFEWQTAPLFITFYLVASTSSDLLLLKVLLRVGIKNITGNHV